MYSKLVRPAGKERRGTVHQEGKAGKSGVESNRAASTHPSHPPPTGQSTSIAPQNQIESTKSILLPPMANRQSGPQSPQHRRHHLSRSTYPPTSAAILCASLTHGSSGAGLPPVSSWLTSISRHSSAWFNHFCRYFFKCLVMALLQRHGHFFRRWQDHRLPVRVSLSCDNISPDDSLVFRVDQAIRHPQFTRTCVACSSLTITPINPPRLDQTRLQCTLT